MRAARKPINQTAAKLLGAGVGFVTLGAGLAVGIYLMVRSVRESDKSLNTFLDNFCTANPFAYIGSKADCITYWGQQQSPQQVCDRADASRCVTFDTSPVNAYLGLFAGGEVTAIVSFVAMLLAAVAGAAVGGRWAAYHNRQIGGGADQQV